MKQVFITGLLCACAAPAQWLAVGAKGGARLSGDAQGYWAPSESKRYVVGPVVEFLLPHGLGIEIDGMYRRFGYRTAYGGFWGGFDERVRANLWEFPIMAKYRLPFARAARPFVSAGYAPRYMSGYERGRSVSVNPITGEQTVYDYDREYRPDVTHGLVAGAGVEFGGAHLRVAPEFRYTRWNKDFINIHGSHGYQVASEQNQMQILVGITWR